ENYSQAECGAFKVQLRVWDRDELGNVLQMIGGTISSVRKDLDNFAGINIYRDGFRVMPYGEPNNDWLRLDLRRVQKPVDRLSNNQIVGYISITADGNPDLKDQSNREGMRESEGCKDLKELMFCSLSRME
ncbi:histidine kinase, partial [Escherichia coli]|nr:histidine kinase [Escherichia coli]